MMTKVGRILLLGYLAMTLFGCSGSGSDSNEADDNIIGDAEDAAASPTRTGDILFTELMADPGSLLDVTGEWFEIQNATTKTLSLLDCVFSVANTNNFSINFDFEIEAGEYKTLAISATPGFAPDIDYNGTGVTFNNLADSITLTCNGVTIDERNYTMTANGRSSALSNNGNGKWCTDLVNNYNGDTGTPGMANIDCP